MAKRNETKAIETTTAATEPTTMDALAAKYKDANAATTPAAAPTKAKVLRTKLAAVAPEPEAVPAETATELKADEPAAEPAPAPEEKKAKAKAKFAKAPEAEPAADATTTEPAAEAVPVEPAVAKADAKAKFAAKAGKPAKEPKAAKAPKEPKVAKEGGTVRNRPVAAAKEGGVDVRLPAVGTVLKREFKGKEIVVTLVPGDDGTGVAFLAGEVLHKSLSGATSALTGKPTPGFAFWGLGGTHPAAAPATTTEPAAEAPATTEAEAA